jgi:uncharacterized membrane protein YqjE
MTRKILGMIFLVLGIMGLFALFVMHCPPQVLNEASKAMIFFIVGFITGVKVIFWYIDNKRVEGGRK